MSIDDAVVAVAAQADIDNLKEQLADAQQLAKDQSDMHKTIVAAMQATIDQQSKEIEQAKRQEAKRHLGCESQTPREVRSLLPLE